MQNLPEWVSNPSGDFWLKEGWLSLDFETTLDDNNRDIVLATWQVGPAHPKYYKYKDAIQVGWGSKYEQQRLVEDVLLADYFVAHHAKFELECLALCGVPLEEVIGFCTMIAEYVWLGNRKADLSLEAVSEKYGLGHKEHLVSNMIKGGICPSEIPRKLLEKYCIQDTNLATKLFLKQRSKLHSLGLLPSMLTRCSLTPILVEIEQNGLYTKGPSRELLSSTREKYSEISNSLLTVTGGINANSPKQVGEYLYDKLGFEELTDHKGEAIRTPKGGRKTGTDVIMQLVAKTEEQKQFKELIVQSIALEDELQFLEKIELAAQNGGIVKANIGQTFTGNHRLNSTGKEPYNIQYQNIARSRKEYFCARDDDSEILEIDQAQLEFRSAAHCGRDERAITDIWDGFDVHTFSAKENNLYLPNGKLDRQNAKAVTFKPLYYGGRHTPWFKAFRGRYPGIGAVQERWINEVLRNKKLTIETGLIFYWPDCHITRSGYIVPSTQICNLPISCISGAEITPIAIIQLWHRAKREVPKDDWLIVNTVHDQVLLEIKKSSRNYFAELGVKCNTSLVYDWLYKVYGIEFQAPLGIGMKAGPAWSKGKELELDVNRDGEIRYRKNGSMEEFVKE